MTLSEELSCFENEKNEKKKARTANMGRQTNHH